MGGNEPRGAGGRNPLERPKGALAGAGAQATAWVHFVAPLLAFLFLGQWLDRRWGTAPWIMMLGVLLGAGGGLYSMYRLLTAAQEQEEARRRAEREARGRAPGGEPGEDTR